MGGCPVSRALSGLVTDRGVLWRDHGGTKLARTSDEAEARAQAGAPAFVYQVDFTSRLDLRRGAFHTIDIPLVFGTIGAKGSQTGTGADAQAASRAMQESFVAFAQTGNPNHAGLPQWSRYDLMRRTTMIFDAVPHSADDPRRWQRELFARVPYIQPGI